MFNFENKTITQLRKEISKSIGEKTPEGYIIEAVTRCKKYKDGISTLHGKKIDWFKACGQPTGKIMYGFSVKLVRYQKPFVYTLPEHFSVVYNIKDKKMKESPTPAINSILIPKIYPKTVYNNKLPMVSLMNKY